MANRLKTWATETLASANLNAEFDNIYAGSIDRTAGRWGSNDDIQVTFGSSQDAVIEWETSQTQDALVLGLSGSNTFIITSKADIATDYGHAANTDPLLVVHSADEATTTDFISLEHNQTNAVINAGGGTLDLAVGGTVQATAGHADATFDIDQASTSGAKPVLKLDQADVSEEFIRFEGTAAVGVLTQSIVDEGDQASETAEGFIKVFVTDLGNQITDQAYYLRLYTLNS